MNPARLIVSDLLSFLFCAFFAWKAAELLHESWAEQTSASPWGPPLWIPYLLMSIGMVLLSCRSLRSSSTLDASQRRPVMSPLAIGILYGDRHCS